jgi:hypothetical protein
VRIIALAPLFLAVAMLAAQARIGEDASQLAERYGSPLSRTTQKPGPDKIGLVLETFLKNGFEVDATLLDGVSVEETFHKVNGDSFTSEEIQTLLADNSEGRNWQAPQRVKGSTQWMRDDGSMATLTDGRLFKITSIHLLTEETRAGELELAPSLQGF